MIHTEFLAQIKSLTTKLDSDVFHNLVIEHMSDWMDSNSRQRAYNSLCTALEIPDTPDTDIPTTPGFYWFTGTGVWPGEWKMVEVFKPFWWETTRKDLYWRYLDGSGGDETTYDVTIAQGDWSEKVCHPSEHD